MKERTADSPDPIPDKLYFRIGEVSGIAGVPSHVLRFWESEFSRINPKRTSAGQRLYSRKDVELILQIKRLLYDRKFTIPGARQFLRASTPEAGEDSRRVLETVRAELESLRDLLG